MQIKKIHIYEDVILNVVHESKLCYVGFDIINEKYAEVSKDDNFIKLSGSILSLFNEKNRFLLASQITKLAEQIAKLMEISDRTVFRYKKTL
jgi:hypothetical protein